MTRGRPAWYNRLAKGEYDHFMVRRRADLAEPFADLALTPHPWPQRALDRMGAKILQVLSLFIQLTARANSTQSAEDRQWMNLALVLTYLNRPNWGELRWPLEASRGDAAIPLVFDSHPDPADQQHADRYELKLYLYRDSVPKEAIEFIKTELEFQVQCGRPVLAIPRGNLDTPPVNWLESMWDLRIRLTDFARRFLMRFRPLDFADPFTVFFLTPSSVSASSRHVHSGHFGYEFVIDGGQEKHLADHKIVLDPQRPLRLPFPNGVCAAVFLEARASSIHDLGDVEKSYKENEVPQHVRDFEEDILGGGLLIEVPAYAPGIGLGAADGPEIIVTFRIQPAPGTALSTTRPANNQAEDKEEDTRISSRVASRDERILRPGEGQVLTEICQRLISIYLRARPEGLGRGIVFRSRRMIEVRQSYLRMAQSDCHILIGGASGTGKSYAADEIYKSSRRSTNPYARMSAGAISRETALSQLFGHKKGVYTGADEDKIGLLKLLDGGTLFLDDVDSLDELSQARLLTYLDTNEFYVYGDEGEKPLKSNVRFICATNINISDLVTTTETSQARMRMDFLYRISEQYFEMPRLKERPEDIPAFIQQFVEEEHKRAGRQFPPAIQPSFVEAAQAYPWEEGDLRQLRSAVLAAMIQSDAEVLTDRELQNAIDLSKLWVSKALPLQQSSLRRLDAACLGVNVSHDHGARLQGVLRVVVGLTGWIRNWTAMPDATIGLVESTTAAADAALLALSPGVETIAVTSAAHPTMRRAVEQAARMLGSLTGHAPNVMQIDLGRLTLRSADVFADEFAQVAASRLAAGPAVLVMEQVTSVEGLRLPIERIGRALRKACPQLRIIIDGAQGVGLWSPPAGVADALVGCFHKFASGQPGTAFLAIDPAWASGLPSHLAVLGELPDMLPFLPTIDLPKWTQLLAGLESGKICAEASAALERVAQFNHALDKALLPVTTMPGAEADPAFRSHISAVLAPSARHAERAVQALASEGFIAQAFDSVVRIAPGPDVLPAWGTRVGAIVRTEILADQ